MPPRRLHVLEDTVAIQVDGETLRARPGEPVAIAMLAAGRTVFGRSVKYHRPRGAACLRGRCDGCLMRVDGVANVMTCRVPVAEGMVVETQNVLGSARADLLAVTDFLFPEGMDHHHMFTRFGPINQLMQKIARRVAGVGKLPDAVQPVVPARPLEVDVLVVGGGRSGVNAANAAAREGATVALLEEEPTLGGTCFKRGEPFPRPGPPIDLHRSTCAIAVHDDPTRLDPDGVPIRTVLAQKMAPGERGLLRIEAKMLILATGSAEGGAVAPGNDRPGVFSARAALTLLEHGVLPGEHVVAIGVGALLQRAIAQLRELGARVTGPVRSTQVTGIGGRPSVEYVKVDDTKIDCDAVLVGGPSTGVYELAGQAGAEVRFDGRGFWVVADDRGQTAHPRTFAVGRCTGRGVDADPRDARPQAHAAGALAAELDQAEGTERAPALPDAVRLPAGRSDKVFVCRCEDVTLHELEEAARRGHRDLEAAKRYTGFGTGWCQGKQCVAPCARLLTAVGGEAPTLPMTPRPPFHPVSLAELAGLPDREHDGHVDDGVEDPAP